MIISDSQSRALGGRNKIQFKVYIYQGNKCRYGAIRVWRTFQTYCGPWTMISLWAVRLDSLSSDTLIFSQPGNFREILQGRRIKIEYIILKELVLSLQLSLPGCSCSFGPCHQSAGGLHRIVTGVFVTKAVNYPNQLCVVCVVCWFLFSMPCWCIFIGLIATRVLLSEAIISSVYCGVSIGYSINMLRLTANLAIYLSGLLVGRLELIG